MAMLAQKLRLSLSSNMAPSPSSRLCCPFILRMVAIGSPPFDPKWVLSFLPRTFASANGTRVAAKTLASQLKEKWLHSMSTPLGGDGDAVGGSCCNEWVVGIDPDTSGAVAILTFNDSGWSAQVFDTPCLQVIVGKRARKRPDARAIVQLLQSFGTPLGTIAYIEQSIPFPHDGKQGWWSGGYTYGLWIGILVASGFSVIPVPSRVWKDHFELSGTTLTKDDSRKAASLLFPSVGSMLKRKKDHGRAEALLIAAYGKGLNVPPCDFDCDASES